MARDATEDKRLQELRKRWKGPWIDAEVARRVEELGQQGRWEEQGKLLVDYIRSHEGIQEMARRAHEAYARGECIPFKDIVKRKPGGRKRV